MLPPPKHRVQQLAFDSYAVAPPVWRGHCNAVHFVLTHRACISYLYDMPCFYKNRDYEYRTGDGTTIPEISPPHRIPRVLFTSHPHAPFQPETPTFVVLAMCNGK